MESSYKEGGSSFHDSVITHRKGLKKQKNLFIPFLQERDGIGKLITEPENMSVLNHNGNNSSISCANGAELSIPEGKVDPTLQRTSHSNCQTGR